MKVRAGVVLIEDDKVALIERYRAGLHYFVFPGGSVKKGETSKQAAVREMEEETGLRVAIKKKLAKIRFNLSRQVYYLAERESGEFGTGSGKEYTYSDPDDPTKGVYIPIWMPVAELTARDNVYPSAVADLVARAEREGWPDKAISVDETPQG
jgi:8-oxo-dGTP pyrophosphatase MutT (NUDIX family)